MAESILDLFKIHRKMILGNTPIVVQNMLHVTPKPFDAVDMILASIGKGLAVVQAVVFTTAFQRIVAPEGVRVVDRSFSGMLSDMGLSVVPCSICFISLQCTHP